MRRGISPVIATVIIVAVAIALSIAVATWIMGLWSGLGGYEALRILPTSHFMTVTVGNATSPVIVIDVSNEGTRSAHVISVQVDGVAYSIDETVQPGETKSITVTLDAQPAPGAHTVKVVTEDGVYQTIIYSRG